MRLACIFLATVAVLTGCSRRDAVTLGIPPAGPAIPVSAALTSTNATVVLHGSMTKKCPVAGCWFILAGDGAKVKVDTKNAGFVVLDVPLGTAMTVAGRIVTNGSELVVESTGLRY